MTTATSWRIRGDVMEACSCDITCPCNFGGDPTQLPCNVVLGFRIQEGNYSNTQLGGLSFVLYASIPGKIFDGGWTLGAYLDQRANGDQMQALGTILTGQAGGMFAALGGLIATALPPQQVAINFETVDGEHRIAVPGLLEVASERIPNPMAGQPPLDAQTTGLAVPFYSGPARVRRAGILKVTDPNLNFEYAGSSSLSGQFDYSGP